MKAKQKQKERFQTIQFPDSILEPIRKGHPWGFSRKFQPFLKTCKPGTWVKIQNSQKKTLGFGIYTPGELVILKVFWHGEEFSMVNFLERIESRLALRNPLWKTTNSMRLLHGENDYLPGITMDFHENTLVTRVYSPFLVSFARYLQRYVTQFLYETRKIKSLHSIFQVPHRVSGSWKASKPFQVWKGKMPDKLNIYHRNLKYLIHPEFQKGGIYNDIRNLRSYLLDHSESLTGERALNLFSNNGFLSLVLEEIGYSQIESLEDSAELIQNAKENLNPKIHTLIKIDIFKQLSSYLESSKKMYDLIIIDPPSLTSGEKDKVRARSVYQKLFSICLPFLNENGIFVLSSCSNRIHLQDFERIAVETFQKTSTYMKLLDKLSPELDHPVLPEFPEGNYFKVLIYKKGKKI